MSHHLPCPVCQSPIPIDLRLLSQGIHIRCPNASCGAAIGIASDSLPTFSSALQKLERLEALKAPREGASQR